ncbi:toll/interleukin-1 receptor domain-containing protein [Paenibacillus sp. alder61]|uniref:toll/interleukin-1 receptor domain-containing protein n=1 Tax=Paenibacillus sp. alder61 TaxID=2862948 RepID=UPI001CD1BAC0|nr:toll/interleukin-1 receptor domain-containing protein [Paenibacillus sp. alder61]MCA1291910.1 toll/interleukin-1 receptor domain-containing protein [Paenibacillus sp. alder61]
MPSIFLSHTSIDKPFVEKLARDLKRIGVNVWFDKWEIRIGESITWKIEEGIRENEYLGLVLSPEALNSEWVKSEIGAAWVKQMQLKKVFVLPIYYRDCDIPLFLADRKFADFRIDYENGFNELASIFGIEETEAITQDNWRKFSNSRKVNWKEFRIREFETLVTTLVDRAIEYNWSSWVGGTANEFSITLSARTDNERKSISIKLIPKTNAYMATYKDAYNPNHLKTSDFDKYVGNSVNACDEFVWREMEEFQNKYGLPIDEAKQFTHRFSRGNESVETAIELAVQVRNKFNWYKGDKLL